MIVDGKVLTEEEFSVLKESLRSDFSKKLVEVAPGQYQVLSRLLG